jgi:RNA polymerase-binding protein DksA
MSPSELATMRHRLLALGQRLRGNLTSLSEEALRGTGADPSGNLSNQPFHLADLATDSHEQDVALLLLENEVQTSAEVVAALERLDRGTFGLCEECGQTIGRERLEAIPYARHCIDCATKLTPPRPPGSGPFAG